MDILSSLLVVAFAGLIHASLQLSTSVLTTLSGHAIGSKKSHARTLRLTSSFVFGAGLMTVLLLATTAYVLLQFYGMVTPQYVWAIAAGLVFGVGIAVWLFYYRKGQGTTLWIPRPLATYLADRAKATKLSAEAFGLGLMSVLGELLFIIGPMIIAALVIINLPIGWQLVGVLIYSVISLLSLGIVWMLVGSGHSLSRIQKWRETNKGFLQFAAGSGLIILGFFIYVQQVITATVGGL
jgi:hypothetical protein